MDLGLAVGSLFPDVKGSKDLFNQLLTMSNGVLHAHTIFCKVIQVLVLSYITDVLLP